MQESGLKMANRIELPWGAERLSLDLPPRWRVLGEFTPPDLAPAADAETLCRESLASPIAAAPLADRDLAGKRVLIVADDVSRPTPVAQFFRSVRDALLAAGARRDDIEILFALGVHRPMTEAEAQHKIGPENLSGHRWHNHNAFDRQALVERGVTNRGTPVWLNRLLAEFDLIVALGAIEPHLLLGFSGGYKMLVPGCAGVVTIGHNHTQGASHRAYNYVGIRPDDSPMRLDLEDAAARCGREVFIVNAALNHDVQPVRFFCGDPLAAQRAGADFVREHTEVETPEPADVVITNSAPFDADLRQGMKCVGNTFFAARPGGVIIATARCDEGRGDMPTPPVTLPYGAMRGLMHLIGPQRIMGFVNVVKRFDPIEQKFLTHFGLQMLHRNHIYLYSEALEPDTGRKLGLIRQFQDLRRLLADASARVGESATVAVFPKGGVTYTRGAQASLVAAR